MSKQLFFLLVLVIGTTTVVGQNHKIVYDLNSNDTAIHSKVLRQFRNILKEAPDAELEVVCHGFGVNMVVKAKALFETQMNELRSQGKVSFKVCANSMKRLGINKSELLAIAEVVPVAILELSSKQQQGWSYIWAGN